MIQIYGLPNAKFEQDKEVVSVINPEVNFENLSLDALNYLWIFGDDDTTQAENPNHIYPVYPTGEYNVTLVAYSEHNCVDTAKSKVIVKNEYTFYAPTAFSPDYDSRNDIFYVYGNGIDHRNFKLFIFDRWGEVIFQSDDIKDGWDGSVKGGKKAKVGTYTWMVIYKDLSGIEHEEAGAVTVIR